MADELPLTGCRAVVVGGASELGRACCHRLAASGALVAVVDGHGIDERGWADAARAVAAVVDRWGGIDLLVNQVVATANDRAPRAFADQDAESIAARVDRSLGAVVAVTRATLDLMIPARRGRIVNVVGSSALRGRPGAVVDDAAQAAVIGLTSNLAEELADHGITAVAVAVGPFGRS